MGLTKTSAGLVSVVIVNWNGRELLARCLPKVLAQTYAPVEVVVVDNGSSDGSANWVAETFPDVTLIRSVRNTGFAAGNNLGIRHCSGEYVATLNNDAFPDREWLSSLVDAIREDDRVGSCASKMLFAKRPSMINSAGIAVDRAGIAWDRLGGEPASSGTEVQEIFGACAGAALYRRAMMDDIGLFDEDFFAYLEDVDLAWRAQWADWKCVYVPDAVIYHLHSATGMEGSRFKNRMLGRNKVWLLCKNYPLELRYAPFVLWYDLMSVAYATATRRATGAVAGRLAAFRGIRRMLVKRRHMARQLSPREMIERLHPLESPLDVRRRYAHVEEMRQMD